MPSSKHITSFISTSFVLGISCYSLLWRMFSVSSLYKEFLFSPKVSMEYELCRVQNEILYESLRLKWVQGKRYRV